MSDSSFPTFFIDRCMGSHIIPDEFRAAGINVVVHDDLFAQDAPDEEWLTMVGEKGWLAVTKDIARAQSMLQRVAIANARACLFVWKSRRLMEQKTIARTLVAAAERMANLARNNPAPFVVYVYFSGELRLVRDSADLISELKLL